MRRISRFRLGKYPVSLSRQLQEVACCSMLGRPALPYLRRSVLHGENKEAIVIVMKLILILLALFTCQAHAAIYKSVNADGDVVYSDTQTQGAEKVQMPALPTYTPPPVPASSVAPPKAPEKEAFYKSFVIVSPANEETIRNNLGVVNIEAKLTPALQTRLKHRVQFYLNGEPYGTPVGKTSLTISNLDRGDYKLSAAVLDAEGNTQIATGDVILYMKRHSILNPPNAPSASPLPAGKP